MKDDLRKNSEGYSDPTAYHAILLADKNYEDHRFHTLLDSIFNICDLADFNIENRIILKDKITGKIYR